MLVIRNVARNRPFGCYETVRSVPHEAARELDALAAAHARDGRTHYAPALAAML